MRAVPAKGLGRDDFRQTHQPEIKPPALRALANNLKQPEHGNYRDHQRNAFCLTPVADPRAPALNGESVSPRDVLMVDMERQGNQRDKEHEQGTNTKVCTKLFLLVCSARSRNAGATRNFRSTHRTTIPKTKPTR